MLDGVDFAVASGQFVSLLGQSGCGKSTLLRAIAGLQRTAAGEIAVQTQREPGPIGMVFQEPALLPWRTARQNVELPMSLLGRRGEARDGASVDELFEAVRLSRGDREKYPDQLSGGMRMRVAIARALVTEPTVLLLDEPFAALDDILRSELNDLLLELWAARSMTVVFVTHNIAEAVYLSQRIAVMRGGRIDRWIEVDLPPQRHMDLKMSEPFMRCYGQVQTALAAGGGR